MGFISNELLAVAMGFSLCESVHAGPLGPWHLRRLTKVGFKYSGGIDTEFLCSDQRVSGWDLKVNITEHHLNKSTCKRCLDEFCSVTGYKLPDSKEL